jgi:hypothetical protein
LEAAVEHGQPDAAIGAPAGTDGGGAIPVSKRRIRALLATAAITAPLCARAPGRNGR